VVALRAEATGGVAAFWAWEAVGLGVAREHEVCCVGQACHLPTVRRRDGVAVACVEVSAVLLVGSELARGTGSLCGGAGGGGARANIAGSIERLVRIFLTATLIT
jgi:hypothetical protein